MTYLLSLKLDQPGLKGGSASRNMWNPYLLAYDIE